MAERVLSDGRPFYRCPSCFDRGYWIGRPLNARGWGEGPWMQYPCEACQGTGGRVKGRKLLDEEIAAIAWFRTATPPTKPFFLRPGRRINNPKTWWQIIAFDLDDDLDQSHRDSAIRVIARLHQLFGSDEVELPIEQEVGLEPEERELEL